VIAVIASAAVVAGCSATEPAAPPPAATRAATVGRPTSAAPPPTSRAAAPADAGAVTLAFTGDMLVSDELRARAAADAGGSGFDFDPMLREVAPILRAADWAVCHQETPISADNRVLSGWPSFSAPYQLAEGEKAAGYDACTTASNHTVDRGASGVKSTLDTLDRVGLRHVGSARSDAESRRLTVYEIKGVRVGHAAYAYGTNGIPPPAPWSVNLIDPPRIRSDAARLRTAGADFVVVSLHFGEEKVATPSAYQRQVVEQVLASKDVDLVIGHHAHVVQPVQRRPDGRWVLFGLGNLLAQQVIAPGESATPPHRDGVIVRVTVGRGQSGRYAVRRVGYVPTFVDAPSDVVRLAPAFSRRRTAAVLTSLGARLVDDTPG
jgi:poly-gamma-glutamate synthesis protein (capsule biosynthesis protein)